MYGRAVQIAVHLLKKCGPCVVPAPFSQQIPEIYPLQPPVDKLQSAVGGDVKADFVSLRPAKPGETPEEDYHEQDQTIYQKHQPV